MGIQELFSVKDGFNDRKAMVTKKLIQKIICYLLAGVFILQGTGIAQDAALNNIIINNTRDNLLLYLEVEGAFRDNMKQAIMNGVPASFSFYVMLFRYRGLWVDEKITDIEITHTMKYDSLKKEYTVHRSWESESQVRTKSFEEAQKLMSEIKGMHVVSLSRLTKGMQYQIKAKAELSKITLPLYLHYVLFFMSLWDFETDWYTIDFTY
ncbi:MAG: DUF4390 domain-containing protein [Pseudomonadota bacterium]